MHAKYLIIGLLGMVLILMPMCTLGQGPNAPIVSPKDADVDPGDVFDLKVSVTAKVNGTYRVTFDERSRFSFPGNRSQEHELTKGDAILFKVPCKVDDGAPDGDFNISFTVTWEYNGTPYEHTDTLRITVGEGADVNENPCESSIIIAGVSVLAFSLVLIKQRKHRKH